MSWMLLLRAIGAASRLSREAEEKARQRDESTWVCPKCDTRTEGKTVCCKKCGCKSLLSVATLKQIEEERRKGRKAEAEQRRAAERKAVEKVRHQREREVLAKARYVELCRSLACPNCGRRYDKTHLYCPRCACPTKSLSATHIASLMQAEFPDVALC